MRQYIESKIVAAAVEKEDGEEDNNVYKEQASHIAVTR
jgi:hypothetical protein